MLQLSDEEREAVRRMMRRAPKAHLRLKATAIWDFSRVTASRLGQCWLEAASSYPEATTIYLVVDSWPVHFHEKVQTAVVRDPRLQLLPLPTYAPWLSNIEKLWRWVKRRVTHAHRWCDHFRRFNEHVREEFRRLAPALRQSDGTAA